MVPLLVLGCPLGGSSLAGNPARHDIAVGFERRASLSLTGAPPPDQTRREVPLAPQREPGAAPVNMGEKQTGGGRLLAAATFDNIAKIPCRVATATAVASEYD